MLRPSQAGTSLGCEGGLSHGGEAQQPPTRRPDSPRRVEGGAPQPGHSPSRTWRPNVLIRITRGLDKTVSGFCVQLQRLMALQAKPNQVQVINSSSSLLPLLPLA